MAASTANLDIRRESLISAGSNVILIAVHLGTLAVLTRLLGTGELGTYFYALSMSFVAIIPSRELSEIMRKRVSEVESPNDEFFGLAQWGTALYLVPFGGALFLLEPFLVANTPLTSATVVAFGVYTAVLTQSAMSTRLYDAVGHPGASMISQSVRESVFLGGVLLLIWANLASAATVLYLRAAVHLATALAIYGLVGVAPRIPSRQSLTSGFEFGKWSFPTGIASRVWEQTPTLLMGVLLGGSAVALYETAKRVTMVGAYLATCINDPLLVKASAMESSDEVLRYIELAIDYTPSVAIPAVFLMAPVATEILVLSAGADYAAGGLILIAIAMTHVLSGVKAPIEAAIRGVDQPKYVFFLMAATLAAGAPAVALGARYGGVEGVALALVALELAGVVLAEVAALKVFDQFIGSNNIHIQFAAAAVAGTFVWLSTHAVDVGPVDSLAAVLAVGTAIHYGLFALWSDTFRNGSVRTARDVVQFVGSVTPT